MANDDRSLRVALVGTSFGCQAHARALKAAGFEVTALVGRDAARTQERARAFGIPAALTSYEQALALPRLDAVVISTPPATHKPYVLQALARGKHVLCEKPMALNAAESQEMQTAARDTGLVNLLVNQLRFVPDYLTLKHAVESGAIGQLKHGTFVLDAGVCIDRENVGVPDWWYDRATGGGWLRNLGSHLFDLVRYTIGEFEAVNASVEPADEFGLNADIAFNVLFRLQNGLQGVMQGCGSTFDAAQIIRVTGNRATAVVEPGGGVWLTTPRGREHYAMPGNYHLPAGFEALPDSPNASRYEINHNRSGGGAEYTALATTFRDAILGRKGLVDAADFNDGVAHMQVLEAIEASVAQGGWVNVKKG
jgi:predicted dehydrogenase